MNIDHLEHDIFLLMLSLSQIRSPERIRQIFLEALNSFWDELSLRFAEQQEGNQTDKIGIVIATAHHSFGYMLLEGDLASLHESQLALIRNAAGMLALILENRLQESLLAEENMRLDEMVQERTSELLRANEALKRQIAERKRAEEHIRQYADIVDKMPIGLHVYHLENTADDTTLRMVSTNAAASEITGLAMQDVLGNTLDENFPDLRRMGIPQAYARVIRSGVEFVREDFYYGDARLLTAAYTVRAFSLPGNCLAVFFENVTERKLAEERIHYLAELVENVSDAIISTDMDFTIKTWNRGAEEIYGWRADDVLGKEMGAVTRIEYLSEAQKDLIKTLFEQGFWKGEVLQRHHDGRPLHILASVTLLRDDNGEPRGTVAINKDITERKQAEEEIRQLNEGLEQRVTQRTAELEAANRELKDFAYIVSHDLKAPLRGINQIAQWLEQDYGDTFDTDGEKMLTLLMDRVHRMDRLIDGILQYSRVGRLQENAGSIDLNELLGNVIDTIAPPRHIHIRVTTELPVVTGDPTRLSQVFQNLLSNAVKFMDKPDGDIRIACRDDEHVWSFSVADNGPGIEQEHYERIFHIFETLQFRDTHESTGIGLSVVKKIIELYGGKIWVESTIGKGATFFFTLPKQ